MGITLEQLKKLNACADGINYFAQHYDGEVPIEKLIADPNMPDAFKYWGVENICITDEQKQLYDAQMNIQSSDYVYQSRDIKSSGNVVKSNNITDSAFIFYSNNIINAHIVVGSSYVNGGDSIYRSDFIDNSCQVVRSTNITRGNNICHSNFVIDSLDIFKSNNITFSAQIRDSSNLDNCFFCADCHNVKNAYFCYNLRDTEPDSYYIFNTKISKVQYDAIALTYSHFANRLTYVDEWPKNNLVAPMVRPHSNYAKHYLLDKDLIRWIKSLPNYSSDIMYNITMNPNFLD